jgi:hypothetical protein
MPQDCAELGKAEPAESEDPFMCLLEDDRLITEFRVLTDRLLTPPDTEELRGVSLIIHVKTLVTDGGNGAWPIFGHDR